MDGIIKTQTGDMVDLRDIKRRLQEDGLDPAAADEEKLVHIWQLYLQTEVSLQGALCSIEEMRSQQASEMSEVENYMQHIRTLSNERETLTLEFEAENEQLKEEIEKLTEELAGYRNQEEVFEMLRQQGLEEIAVGNTSEQIAYLLVERARLMDELEAEQAKVSFQTPEGAMTAAQLWDLIQSERQDFEEELAEQRDSLRDIKEQMKRSHEEELASLMNENEQAQDLLEAAQMKVTKLEKQVENLSEELANQEGGDNGNTSTLSSNDTAAYKALKEELEDLKEDNDTLCKNVKSLTQDLQQARSRVDQEAEQQARIVDVLKSDKQRQQKEISELALALNELRMARSNEETSPRNSDKGVDEPVLSAESDELEEGLRKSLDNLKTENRSLSHDLSVTKLELKKEKERLSELQGAGQDADAEQSTKSKIRSLENKVGDLEGDLAISQRALWAKQNEYKKFVNASPTPRRRSLDIASRSNSLSGGKDMMAEVERLQIELAKKTLSEKQLSDQQSRVTELETSVSQLQEENKGLAQELQDALAQCEELREKQQDEATKAKTAAESEKTKESLSKDVEDLRKKLEDANNKLRTSEEKVESLQRDLQNTLRSMKPGQDAVKELRALKDQLDEKDQEIDEMEAQIIQAEEETAKVQGLLDKERTDNLAVERQLDEVTQALSESERKEREMNERNIELHNTLQDLTSNVDKLKEDTSNKEKMLKQESESVGSVKQQLADKQAELDALQAKLTRLHDKFESQMAHYTERKERTKSKLQKARDLFNQEKAKLRQKQEKLEAELAMVRSVMSRETEWKGQLEENYRKLLDDKRNLLTQVAEHEETTREQTRSVSMMQVRVRYLEEENATLQVRIDSLTRQKHNLDRLVKELQMDRQRELSQRESNLSSLLSSAIDASHPSSGIGSYSSFTDSFFKKIES